MKFLVVVSCLLAIAYAKPGVVAPIAYTGVVPASSFGYSYSSHVAAPVALAHSAVVAPVAHSAVVAPVAHSTFVSPIARAAVVAAPATTVVASPVAHAIAPAVVGVEKSQYHAQDTLGQAAYGHSEAFQAHSAVQDASGNKIGSYSYVAPDGQVIATNYVADALGYRVASNAAPVVPAESAEVVAARTAHLAEVAKHRSRRGLAYAAPVAAYTAPLATTYHTAPVVTSAYSSHVVAAPHAYAYRYY